MKEGDYTVKELAKAAGLSGAYIRQLLIEGKQLNGYKVGDGRRGIWLISKREAERWLSERDS